MNQALYAHMNNKRKRKKKGIDIKGNKTINKNKMLDPCQRHRKKKLYTLHLVFS
jgi:hypothetical protein